MMRPNDIPLISELEIQSRVRQLAEEINTEYGDGPVLVLVVLKGAVMFAADILKHLKCQPRVDFIRTQSYAGTASKKEVEFTHWPACDLSNRNILIIEDILDTGRTCNAIIRELRVSHPATIKICALLDKPECREVPVEGHFVGFTIENAFVVGYGLDYNESYRHLSSIYELQAN